MILTVMAWLWGHGARAMAMAMHARMITATAGGYCSMAI